MSVWSNQMQLTYSVNPRLLTWALTSTSKSSTSAAQGWTDAGVTWGTQKKKWKFLRKPAILTVQLKLHKNLTLTQSVSWMNHLAGVHYNYV